MVLSREYSQTFKTTNFRNTLTEQFLPVFQHAEAVVSVQRCSVKKVSVEISQNSQENTCSVPESLFWQSCRPKACNFIKKETPAQVFSCEFCEISKNTFSYRTPPVAASEHGGIKYHLSHIFPMTPLDPHENIRKPKIFDVFKGYRKGAWVKCVTISKLYLKPYLLLIRRTKT